MTKIRIDYEVPDNDCYDCKHSHIVAPPVGLACELFSSTLKIDCGFFMRCQACIDAEVKEGVYAK